jgi:hypothetical protein
MLMQTVHVPTIITVIIRHWSRLFQLEHVRCIDCISTDCACTWNMQLMIARHRYVSVIWTSVLCLSYQSISGLLCVSGILLTDGIKVLGIA